MVRLIILFFVAIVAVPCFIGYWPIEQAKFYLAAAENSLDKANESGDERVTKARDWLRKAKACDPNIELNVNYLRILDRIEPVPLERILTALTYLSSSTRKTLGANLAEDAFKRHQFEKSYQILSKVLSFEETKTAEERNRLAYGAALAKKDLTLALREVDLALAESHPEPPGILDTKAWLLHELHRDEEALELISRALKIFNQSLLEVWSEKLQLTKDDLEKIIAVPESAEQTPSPIDVSTLKNKALTSILRELAIYQYHRAEILTSLKQLDKAEWAFDWLEARGYKDFGDLF